MVSIKRPPNVEPSETFGSNYRTVRVCARWLGFERRSLSFLLRCDSQLWNSFGLDLEHVLETSNHSLAIRSFRTFGWHGKIVCKYGLVRGCLRTNESSPIHGLECKLESAILVETQVCHARSLVRLWWHSQLCSSEINQVEQSWNIGPCTFGSLHTSLPVEQCRDRLSSFEEWHWGNYRLQTSCRCLSASPKLQIRPSYCHVGRWFFSSLCQQYLSCGIKSNGLCLKSVIIWLCAKFVKIRLFVRNINRF